MTIFRKTSAIKVVLWASIIIAFAIIARCSSTKQTAPIIIDDVIETNVGVNGTQLEIRFIKGEEHNHPLMVIWTENTDGEFIETLYVAQSIGKGVFQHGKKTQGQWEPGVVRRPAALPYWGHQRGIQASDGYYIPDPENPVADAITGPTPQNNFILRTSTTRDHRESFYVLFEINQSWDWNEYWTNNKYPDDINYKTSSQPALVYSALIDPDSVGNTLKLEPVGRSHYSGADGILYDDLNTITTAFEIAEEITVTVTSSN